ncbi:MAG: capsule assembly Wzi family protein, partial [Opitutales bacterium]
MGSLHAALHDAKLGDGSSSGIRAALERTRVLLNLEKQPGWAEMSVEVSVRSESPLLRSFLDTPREKQEAIFSTSWLGDRFAGGLNVGGGFDRGTDWRGRSDKVLRFDGSYLAARAGNYSFSLDQLDRWWGPGWDGSLILSNNARPV